MAVLAITFPLSVAQHIMAQPLFASSLPSQHRATPMPSRRCCSHHRDIRTTSPSPMSATPLLSCSRVTFLINNQTSSRWLATTCFLTICFIVTLTVASERATKVHQIRGTVVSPRLWWHCYNENWKTLLFHSKTLVACSNCERPTIPLHAVAQTIKKTTL